MKSFLGVKVTGIKLREHDRNASQFLISTCDPLNTKMDNCILILTKHLWKSNRMKKVVMEFITKAIIEVSAESEHLKPCLSLCISHTQRFGEDKG